MLTTKKIEYLTDDTDPSMVYVPVESYEELKKLVDDREEICVYSGKEYEGTVYSFDPSDEKNPSQNDLREQTYEWLENKIEDDEELSKILNDDYDGEISEMAYDYVDEYWKSLNKPFMLETDDAGPFGGRHGIINAEFGEFNFYRKIEFADYLESLN